jgi:hypothetical protein
MILLMILLMLLLMLLLLRKQHHPGAGKAKQRSKCLLSPSTRTSARRPRSCCGRDGP